MRESTERMIESIRQRNLNDDEIARASESARRMELGARALEKIRAAGEAPMIEAATEAARQACGANPNQDLLDFASPAFVQILRQSLFAAATDDWTGLATMVREMVLARRDSAPIDYAPVECGLEALAAQTAARLEPGEAALVGDAMGWAGRVAVAGLAVESQREAVSRSAIRRFCAEHPSDSSAYPAWAEIFLSAADGVLGDALELSLGEGSGVVPPPFGAEALSSGSVLSLAQWRLFSNFYLDEAQARIGGTRGRVMLKGIRESLEWLLASIEVNGKLDEWIEAAFRIAEGEPQNLRLAEPARADVAARLRSIACAILRAASPAGGPTLVDEMQNAHLFLQKLDLGAAALEPLLHAFSEEGERRLTPPVWSLLSSPLERVCDFLLASANLIEHKTALLDGSLDEWSRSVAIAPGQLDFVRNWAAMDLELALFNLALCGSPGSDRIAAGRLASLGETLLQTLGGREQARGVLTILEASISKWFTPSASSFMNSKLKAFRALIDGIADQAECETALLEILDGLDKKRGLNLPDGWRVAMQTATRGALSALNVDAAFPEGSSARGLLLEAMADRFVQSPPNPDALDIMLKTLVKTLETRLGTRSAAVLTELNTLRGAARAFAVAARELPAVSLEAANAALQKRPGSSSTDIARLARLAGRALRAAGLACVPGGESVLGEWVLQAAGRGLEGVELESADLLAALRRIASAKLDRATSGLMDPKLAAAEGALRALHAMRAALAFDPGAVTRTGAAGESEYLEALGRVFPRVVEAACLSSAPGAESEWSRTLAWASRQLPTGLSPEDILRVWTAAIEKARIASGIADVKRPLRRLADARDWLTLEAGLARHEGAIITDALPSLAPGTTSGDRQRLMTERHARRVLRAGVRALLPTRRPELEAAWAALAAHQRRINPDLALWREGCKALQTQSEKRFTAGPVKELSAVVRESAERALMN